MLLLQESVEHFKLENWSHYGKYDHSLILGGLNSLFMYLLLHARSKQSNLFQTEICER